MTGFGRGEINLPDRRLSVEIATVNQKNLQVSCYAPEEWSSLETLSAPWIRARLVRGKVTVRVTFADVAGCGDHIVRPVGCGAWRRV